MQKGFISFPSSKALNPFIFILNENLKKFGWEERYYNVWLKPIALLKVRRQVNVLYFHWPESLWRSNSLFISIIKALIFICYIRYTKFLGIKVVFSGHNVLPHFGNSYVPLEIFMRKWILRNFDLIVGHASNAKSEFENTFKLKIKKYSLAIHGNYCDHYKSILPKENARKELNIPIEEYIILLKYDKNPYKGSLDFIKKIIEQDIDCYLLITGNPSSEFLSFVNRLKKYKIITENTNGIKGFLSEETLIKTICASDMVALPYKSITTSGTYFLALTFNKPVIAPDLPFFKMHTSEKTALLYNSDNPDLKIIFSKISKGWKPDEEEIIALKNKFSWKTSSEIISNSFNQILQ